MLDSTVVFTGSAISIHDLRDDTQSTREPPVGWCPACHELQAHGRACNRCGPDHLLTPLARGLASLEVAGEHGLVRYQGDQLTTLVGLALVLMLPTSAAIALAGDASLISPMLVGLCFVGVPVLALVDAHRAGIAISAAGVEMPSTLAPEVPAWLAGEPAEAAEPDEPDELAGSARPRHGTRVRGVVARVQEMVRAPVSEQGALAYRVDIRAGRDAELVARRTQGAEFLVTCGDGSQVLITGVLELVAPDYGAVDTSGAIDLELNGTRLLPLMFSRGGWACELVVCEGDAVDIEAPASQEQRVHPLDVGYRNAGIISVLRGTPGQPVVIRRRARHTWSERQAELERVPN